MDKAAYEKLLAIREREDLSLKPTPLLRTTIRTLDGKEKEFKLRHYQVQMVLHLLAMKRFIVGDDTGLGKCCRRGTLVFTNKGLVPVEALQPGEMEPGTFAPIEGWRVAIGGGATAPVKRFYYGGVKPTRKATTRYGFEIEGTLVHPMLAFRDGEERFVKFQDLKVGDHLCVERNTEMFPEHEPVLEQPSMDTFGKNARQHDLPTHLTPDLARLLGYVVGEAWVNNNHIISISQSSTANPDIHADIYSLCENFWPDVTRVQENRLDIHSVQIRNFLEAMGIDKVVAAGKRVPDPILRATRSSTREFLRGLFEGEGGPVNTGGIEYTSASERLAREVQLLLLRFGIVAKRSPKKVPGYDHTYWRLTIFGDDAVLFKEKIGFISDRKRERLAEVLPVTRNTNHDVIPKVRDLFDQVRVDLKKGTTKTGANGHRKGSGLKQFGAWLVCGLNNIRNFGRDPSYHFARKVVDLLQEHAPEGQALPRLRAFLSTQYFYDPIVSLEDGEAEVFDIEVDNPRHSFVGNGLINHNTAETIASLCYIWRSHPDQKVIVLTKKSAVPQWVKEFAKFTVGVKTIMVKGTPAARKKLYQEWEDSTGPTVLVAGYSSLKSDFAHIQDWEGYIVAFDECTVFKNPKTQVHQVCKFMAQQADRVWGLTATLIKNNLMEGFGIYKVIVPGLFPHSTNSFMQEYCITRMQRVQGNRQIPVIVGYRQSDISRFRLKIDPYYLGRPKHQVAKELPVLTTKDISVGMTRFQHEKYQEALAGLLELGTGEEKETDKLTSIIYCQQIANHPALIDYVDEKSEKLDALVEMLSEEGDFEGDKVIVFTRFKKMVDFAVPLLEKKGIKSVRVTGSEDEDQRADAMERFQDPNSGVNVIWITMAGGDAINLQMAKALVFFDTPWSAGDYLQILGRMVRIGSPNDRVYAVHLIAEGTIDERVQEVLNKKMTLVESILGKRLLGEGEEDTTFEVESDITKLFDSLREDAHKILSVK